MKKFVLLLAMAIIGATGAFAQKGGASIGFNLGVVPSIESGMDYTNFDFGAFGRYNFTRQWRGEIAFNYGFEDKGISQWDLGAAVHYMAPVSRRVSLYPLVGMGVAHVMGKHDWSADRFMFNVGMGVECALTSRLSMGAEIKYQYVKDFNRLPILVSLSYKL